MEASMTPGRKAMAAANARPNPPFYAGIAPRTPKTPKTPGNSRTATARGGVVPPTSSLDVAGRAQTQDQQTGAMTPKTPSGRLMAGKMKEVMQKVISLMPTFSEMQDEGKLDCD